MSNTLLSDSIVSRKKLENSFACVSTERFVKKVASSSKEEVSYEVRYERVFNVETENIDNKWICNCLGYLQWHTKKENFQCKHIRETRRIHWCGWRQKEEGSEPVKYQKQGMDDDYTCPNCGRLAYPEG